MHILYKYCPPERASILHEHKIAYSHRSAINDVFEMQPSVQLQFSGKLTSPANDRKIVHETLDSALVLCLSETWDNIPMWSYYADGHKGFVIGLAAGHGFFNGSRARPVTYCAEYLVVNHKAGFEAAIFNKFEQWKHEREWRSLRVLDHDDAEYSQTDNNNGAYLYKFAPELVKEVVLGCRIENTTRTDLCTSLSVSEYQHVSVYEAKPDDGNWKLVRRLTKP